MEKQEERQVPVIIILEQGQVQLTGHPFTAGIVLDAIQTLTQLVRQTGVSFSPPSVPEGKEIDIE
jgi:hypothetical protein